MMEVDVLQERTAQDYRSTYNDIRDWFRQEREGKAAEESKIDWDDVVFEIDLLKSQEIDLDYILELVFEHNKKTKDKDALIDEVRRIIRSSIGNRAKEGLVVDVIHETDLDPIPVSDTHLDVYKRQAIESSANGYDSEHDIKGLFADFDTTSNRLGNTVEEKNKRLAAVIKGVESLDLSLIHI